MGEREENSSARDNQTSNSFGCKEHNRGYQGVEEEDTGRTEDEIGV